MKTINEFLKTYIPEDYNGFSADKFLDSKKLRIENVKKERVQGLQVIKIDVRVVEDINGENENKVFTIRLDRNDNMSKEEFREYLNEARNNIGQNITIDPHTDVKEAYFYQQRMLTLIVNHFEVDSHGEKENTQLPEMKDRPLKNLAEYRVFDIDGFFEENDLKLVGTYFEKGNVIFNVLIEEEALIKFAVPVEKADVLPAELMTLNGDVDDIIEDYNFSNASSHRYGTRWTLYFDEFTFKAGTLTQGEYKLRYDASESNEINNSNESEEKEEHKMNDFKNEGSNEPRHSLNRRRFI